MHTTSIHAETEVSLILKLCNHKALILEFEHQNKGKSHTIIEHSAKGKAKSIAQTDINSCDTLRRYHRTKCVRCGAATGGHEAFDARN